MLKPLTLSLSLAVALSASSLSWAGHHGGLASAQCETPSPQGVVPSAQCGEVCGPKHRGGLCNWFKHRQKCYTYEWVLKKRRCGGLFGHHGGGCGNACDTCGEIYPSGQAYGSAQGPWGSGQGYGYGSGQALGAGQMGSGQGMTSGQGGGTAAPTAPEAPPAPAAPAETPAAPPAPPAAPAPTASNSGGLLFLSPAGN